MLKLFGPLLITALLGASFAQAGDYNKPRHLNVGSHAKISRVLAKSRAMAGSAGETQSGQPACGQERDGVIIDRGIGKEKIVVVTKDIVNNGGTVEIGRDCE